MQEVIGAVNAFAEKMKPDGLERLRDDTERLRDDTAEDIVRAAQTLAAVALRDFRGPMLTTTLAACEALANMAWELEGNAGD